MKLDHDLRALSMILSTACDFVIAFTATANAPDAADAESLQLLSTLWAQKMDNRHLSFEAELASHVRRHSQLGSTALVTPAAGRCVPGDKSTTVQVTTGYGAMYIVILAIDTITALIHSVAATVDRSGSGRAVHSLPASPAKSSRHEALDPETTVASPRARRPSGTSANGAAGDGDSPSAMSQSGPRHSQGSTAELAAPAYEARFATAHAMHMAQEQMWAELEPVTEQHGHLLLAILWKPALEVWPPHYATTYSTDKSRCS